MNPEEREPDYRFTLANERTFLSWIRTGLALLAGSVAVVQLAPKFGYHDVRHALGLVLALLGAVVAVGSVRRWQQVERAMRRDQPLPASPLPWVLGAGLAAVAVLVGVFLAISAA